MQWITSVPEKRVRRVSPVSIIVVALLLLMLLALWVKGWLALPDQAPEPPEPTLPNAVSTIKPVPLPSLESPTPIVPETTPVPVQSQTPGTVSGSIPETGPGDVVAVFISGGLLAGFVYYKVRQRNLIQDAWRSITVLN